jgi:hypothetical protein
MVALQDHIFRTGTNIPKAAAEILGPICGARQVIVLQDRENPPTSGMIAALARMHEFKIKLRGTIVNGVTKVEGREIITQKIICCGVPAVVDCRRVK